MHACSVGLRQAAGQGGEDTRTMEAHVVGARKGSSVSFRARRYATCGPVATAAESRRPGRPNLNQKCYRRDGIDAIEGRQATRKQLSRGRERGKRGLLCKAKIGQRKTPYRSRRNKYGPFEVAYRWLEEHDLVRRVLITIVAVLISRLCYLLPIPGLDERFLADFEQTNILGELSDPFGSLLKTPGNLFMLGFGPLICSSVSTAILVNTFPPLKERMKEGDGRLMAKDMALNFFYGYTCCLSLWYAFSLSKYMIFGSKLQLFLNLVCGSMILKTMCQAIDEFGIGDGFLNILLANTGVEYVVLLRYMLSSYITSGIPLWQVLVVLSAMAVGCLTSVWLVTSRENMPIKYYKKNEEAELQQAYRLEQPYVPFLRNPGGLQPLILAYFLFQVPLELVQKGTGLWYSVGSFINQPLIFFPMYFLMIYLLCYLDITDSAKEMSSYLSRVGALVPGVRPGERTTRYIEKFRKRTISKGAFWMATFGTLSMWVEQYLRREVGVFVSMTSLLLAVNAFVLIRRQVIAYQQAPKLASTIRDHERLLNSSMISPFQ